MGGSMKGHSNSGNRGGRPYQYGLMLLLAFGAAIFGVMVLHKLREKRIFNLLLKQKDRDFISLQLLLQKEKDYSKDVKRKSEEMKAKIYSFRTHKMELDSRILKMQSTISSLKDEQRTMESALEEEKKKKKENKLNHDKDMALNKEHQQVIALTEILKQKEAEIDDLKHRLENPVNVWSVSTDDPSRSMARQDKYDISGIKDKSGGVLESTGYRDGENSTRDADGSRNESTDHRDEENSSSNEDTVEFVDRREMTEERSQKLENSQGDGGQGKKMGDSANGEGSGLGEENKIANATHIINPGEVSQTRGGTSNEEVKDAKENEIAEIGQSDKLSFQDGKGRILGANSKGGMKMDMPNNSQTGTGYRVRGKSKTKGKRWRMLAKNKKNGNSESSDKNIDVSIGSIQSTKDGMGSKTYKSFRDGELKKLDRHQNHNMRLKMKDESGQVNGKLDAHDNHQSSESLEMTIDDQVEDSTKEVIEAVASNDVKLLKPQNTEDPGNVIVKVRNTDINQEIEGQEGDVEYENSEKPLHSPGDVPKNRTVDGNVNGTAGGAGKQITGEAKAEVISGIEQQTESRDVDKADSNSEETEVVEKSKEQEEEDSEVSDTKEAETDMLMESRSESEEDKENYNEPTDEAEF